MKHTRFSERHLRSSRHPADPARRHYFRLIHLICFAFLRALPVLPVLHGELVFLGRRLKRNEMGGQTQQVIVRGNGSAGILVELVDGWKNESISFSRHARRSIRDGRGNRPMKAKVIGPAGVIALCATLVSPLTLADECGKDRRVAVPSCMKLVPPRASTGLWGVDNQCDFAVTLKFDQPGSDEMHRVEAGVRGAVRGKPEAKVSCCPAYGRCR